MSNPLFLIPVMVGPIFMIAGFILLKSPPKQINHLYGYRTPGSKKNQERWDFAQQYSARLMIKTGIVLALLSVAGLFLELNLVIELILAIALLVGSVILLTVKTERKLNEKFPIQP
jgi:uncharacterized membrane protein